MQSSWKVYLVLFLILVIVQSQAYVRQLRQSLSIPQSIQPLTTYELVVSTFAAFAAFVVLESLIKNEVF